MTMDPKVSPKAVNNFVFLARQQFYDGTFFHRVQNQTGSFAIVQGGDPQGNGQGGPGYDYIGETPPAGTKYLRGVVAMAKPQGNPPRNGSQFFFVVRDWPDLPAEYTILGKVDDSTSLTNLDKMILAKGSDLGGLGVKPEPPIYVLKVTIEEFKRS
jgi:peptidyl-prolyl cis-trans isomerase B (cyclophilin B)